MPVLSSELRKDLGKACVRGRKAAEKASRVAIRALGVHDDRAPAHLSDEDRDLRRALRAKRDQIGDPPAKVDLLAADCAYEQWHRLLFARFLAENGLLIHPQYKAPLTLVECDDLAADLGEPDAWGVASRFAAEILPGIFRLDDPCVRLRLAPEGRLELEQIVEDIPEETFAADDALGWVYQYWQKERKDEVNASERKIGGADLAPVTQLFTENYMVRFVLENSLGAWWASRRPDSPLVREWEYLRFDDNGKPAAGSFDGWPPVVAELTVMDPCCGSGHFLVAAFGMLWRMRAEEEGLVPAVAQDAVLRDNLFGLELDPRCVQIAMFAVALQSWKSGGGWRELPVPNIACSGIPVKAPVDEWKALANGDERLEAALSRLYVLFRDADTLGSLIDPRRNVAVEPGAQQSLEDVGWDRLSQPVRVAAGHEREDPARSVLGADAIGLVGTADLLSRRYSLVATNPPFLGRGSQSQTLQRFVDRWYAAGRQDLATAFLLRASQLASPSGTAAFVLPQNWLTLGSYESLRRTVLVDWSVKALANLGPGAFDAIIGEVVKPVLTIVQFKRDSEAAPMMLDAAHCRSVTDKAGFLATGARSRIAQARQLRNPDARILFEILSESPPLAAVATSFTGTQTGEDPRFKRFFWEQAEIASGWARMQSAPSRSGTGLGRERIVLWESGAGVMAESSGSTIRGRAAWSRRGLVVSKVGSLYWTDYAGELFDDSAIAIIPSKEADIPAIAAYLDTPDFRADIRRIDQKVAVTPGTMVKVPFEVDYWRAVAEVAGALPEPCSDDPTQWLFKGRPDASTEPLQVAVARLLGYRWPEQPEDDGLNAFADADGIVCLPSVLGEATAADRLHQLLARAFGGTWSPAHATELLAASGAKKLDLDAWLRDEFFKAHCQVFKNRPFVWHVWDGRKDGFAALVNYHRLDRPTLERLTYTYLGDWIERQTAAAREDVVGAAERLAAARELKHKLELLLIGEPPYDIYVRWKPLAQQAIGWAPDVDDGVRLNVRPFVEARVLRTRFNVKWEKDRGKNPDGSERHNDLHFTNAEKQAARGA